MSIAGLKGGVSVISPAMDNGSQRGSLSSPTMNTNTLLEYLFMEMNILQSLSRG